MRTMRTIIEKIKVGEKFAVRKRELFLCFIPITSYEYFAWESFMPKGEAVTTWSVPEYVIDYCLFDTEEKMEELYDFVMLTHGDVPFSKQLKQAEVLK